MKPGELVVHRREAAHRLCPESGGKGIPGEDLKSVSAGVRVRGLILCRHTSLLAYGR